MKEESVKTINLIGAITANVYMVLVIALLIVRILEQPEISRSIGLVSTIVLIPLVYLFVTGLRINRPRIYFIWLGLMILFVIFELIIDHILQLDFRNEQWSAILYVMFFFGATGGMIGVAAQAGKLWVYITSIVFLVMLVLSFIQRAITGL